MADPWIPLLIGGTLLLVGFAATLVFERYRVPDFFMLLLLGVVLGHIPWAPFGPTMVDSLGPILPSFIGLTLAMIMFEGGLSLNPATLGEDGGALAKHILGAMALTIAGTWLLATRVLGLSDLTGLVLAAAFSGPSAAIVVSFAPHLGLRAKALNAIVLEGVLGNVVAAVVVLMTLRIPGVVDGNGPLTFLSQVILAAAFAFFIGFAWRTMTGSLLPYKFQYIATLALAVVVYALAEGFISGNGPIAAFVLGLTLAHRGSEVEAIDAGAGAGFAAFQKEISFGLRTFFFVYLGLLVQFTAFSVPGLIGAALLTVGFVAARVPTSRYLRRAIGLTARESRALLATVARGMTDVVLVLFAVQSGLLPAGEGGFLLASLPLLILLPASACTGLLAWAERGSSELPAKGPVRKDIYEM